MVVHGTHAIRKFASSHSDDDNSTFHKCYGRSWTPSILAAVRIRPAAEMTLEAYSIPSFPPECPDHGQNASRETLEVVCRFIPGGTSVLGVPSLKSGDTTMGPRHITTSQGIGFRAGDRGLHMGIKVEKEALDQIGEKRLGYGQQVVIVRTILPIPASSLSKPRTPITGVLFLAQASKKECGFHERCSFSRASSPFSPAATSRGECTIGTSKSSTVCAHASVQTAWRSAPNRGRALLPRMQSSCNESNPNWYIEPAQPLSASFSPHALTFQCDPGQTPAHPQQIRLSTALQRDPEPAHARSLMGRGAQEDRRHDGPEQDHRLDADGRAGRHDDCQVRLLREGAVAKHDDIGAGRCRGASSG